MLKNEFLGTVRLPRGRVAMVLFGTNSLGNFTGAPLFTNIQGKASTPGLTNNPSDLASQLRQLAGQTNAMEQIETQMLGGAGPEAKNKYNDLLGGLISGRLGVDDIRLEARTAADQLRAARKDLGEDAGPLLDSYLAILDHFLRETTPSAGSGQPQNKAPPKTTPPVGGADEE
jgi:hypothetical protein